MDLRSGYWQVPLHESSKPLTTFTTYQGLYQFKVLPFGLTNAPSTFQRIMECVLRGLNWKSCLIYLDDIIVFSRTFDEHLLRLRDVFERFRDADLKLKPTKCSFAKDTVKFLGHIITPKGISPDTTKVTLVQNFPTPITTKQVKSFLGLAGYYRRFIQDFSKIAHPLHQLLKKNAPFHWTHLCQESFEFLKNSLTNPPILSFPDFTAPFQLYVDASGYALGMVLSQKQDGLERVIAYGWRALNSAEQNYSTTEQEALAVVEGIKHFEPYIYGRKFTIYTDHHSLKWLMTLKEPRGRLCRWALRIQQYDFDVQHRPGRVHSNADALSRLPYSALNALDVPSYIPNEIRDQQVADLTLYYLIYFLDTNKLHTDDPTPSVTIKQSEHYFLDDNDVLYHIVQPETNRKNTAFIQLVVPHTLRFEILSWAHYHITGGHFGVSKTYEKVRRKYVWAGLFADVQHWCKSCTSCGSRKRPVGQKKAPLIPISGWTSI